jgi:hypothetical protein
MNVSGIKETTSTKPRTNQEDDRDGSAIRKRTKTVVGRGGNQGNNDNQLEMVDVEGSQLV